MLKQIGVSNWRRPKHGCFESNWMFFRIDLIGRPRLAAVLPLPAVKAHLPCNAEPRDTAFGACYLGVRVGRQPRSETTASGRLPSSFFMLDKCEVRSMHPQFGGTLGDCLGCQQKPRGDEDLLRMSIPETVSHVPSTSQTMPRLKKDCPSVIQ